MKLKIVVIDLEIPSRVKRWALRIGIPAVVLTVAAVALAAPLHTWNNGDPLNATDLNGNFSQLQGQASQRPTCLDGSMTAVGGVQVNCTTTQVFVQAESITPTFSNGRATVTLPAPFPNHVLTVVVSYGDTTGTGGMLVTQNYTTSTFDVVMSGSTTTGLARVNYVAYGW